MAVNCFIDLSHTALLLIDIQRGFDDPSHWGTSRSNPNFESHIQTLLSTFRASDAKSNIFHVCHHSTLPKSPLHPSKEGAKFYPYAAPQGDERVFPKSVNSPFVETELESVFRQREISRVFVCGLMTNHCVDTTVRHAANLGVVDHVVDGEMREGEIVLVDDATAAFNAGPFDADTVHAVHVLSLRDEFCETMKTEEVVRELKREGKPRKRRVWRSLRTDKAT